MPPTYGRYECRQLKRAYMSEESQEQVVETPEAVEAQAETETSAEVRSEADKQVPLSALEAERRKRQEAEQQAQWLYQQMNAAQAQYKTQQPSQDDDEDEYTKEIKDSLRREVRQEFKSYAEQQYLSQHPEATQALQEHLPRILEQKPWLTEVIKNAPNRYARAMEIINDYAPRSAPTPESRRRIEENAQKPGSPQGVGKTSQLSKLEMISKMSPEEFRDYRKRVRSGR